MSWIKDNKFVVALGAGTLVGVILIFLAGSKGAARYLQAKEDFDATSAEVTLFEGRALYPRSENCDGKSKALDEYRQATAALQTAFETYRPKELKNVSPEDFANQLKAVNGEVRKTCEDAGTKVPEPFFCGFENYKIGLAPGNATGILNYQLSGIQTLICALAKSGATELHNFHRATLPEEDGREYKPGNFEVARSLPFEITFSGPEKSARAFLSAVIKQKDYYFVIRTISATNSKKEPPRSSDAKFDKPAPPPPAATDGIFSGGGFVLPPTDEQPKVDDKKPAPGTAPAPAPGTAPGTTPAKPPASAPPAAIPAPALPAAIPAPATGESTRILSQVLGHEEVQVFLRLDLMQFLPLKKLP